MIDNDTILYKQMYIDWQNSHHHDPGCPQLDLWPSSETAFSPHHEFFAPLPVQKKCLCDHTGYCCYTDKRYGKDSREHLRNKKALLTKFSI